MTPVFFHLNTDLEIMIQIPASYRFGDCEWSHSFEYTQTYLTNCIFKKCLHVWTILQVFSEQEKQRPLNYSTLKRCTIHLKELPAVETASMSIQWRQGRGYDLTKENSLCWYNLLYCSAITNHGHACSSVGKSVHYNAITGKHVEASLGGEKNPNESSPPCRRGLNYIIILHLLQSYSNEILY